MIDAIDTTELSADEVLEVRPGATPAGLQCLDVPSTSDLRTPTVAFWSGTFVDASLVRLALAREVLPAWTAHLLHRLETTRGYLKLGRASIRDYAREDLGLTPWQTRDLRRLGAGLARFPSLREAMLAGKLTEATARRLLKVLGDDSEVAAWLSRLEAAPSRLDFNEAVDAEAKAREEEAGPDASREVRYERLSFTAPASLLGRWHEGLALARKLGARPAKPDGLRRLLPRMGGSSGLRPPVPPIPPAPLPASGRSRRQEGPALARGESVEMWAADWLAAHPAPAPEVTATEGPDTDAPRAGDDEPRWRREAHTLWRDLDRETNHWEFLSWLRPRAALAPEVEEVLAAPDDDAFALHDKLLYLVRLGQQLDFQLARVLHTAHRMGLWRKACFASFGHYVTERLGLRPRRAYYLVALHRRLLDHPDVAHDFRAGRIGWHQATQLCRIGDANPSERQWRVRAVETSAARLEDEVDWLRRLDALRPRDTIFTRWAPPPEGSDLVVVPYPEIDAGRIPGHTLRIAVSGPADALATIRLALTSVRAVHGAGLADADCFARLIDSFFAAHDTATSGSLAREHCVFHRDGWRCRMPGCRSPGPLHRHHILWRSRGGGDEDENCISLCWVHHQLVIHQGHAVMTGRAPGEVRVELGVRAGFAPRSRWLGERRLDVPASARPRGRDEEAA